MKKNHLLGILVLAFVVVFSGCNLKKAKKVKLSSFHDSVSYAIGANIGKNLRTDFKQNNIPVNWDLLINGLRSQLKDTIDMFSEAQKDMIMEKFKREMQDIQQEIQKKENKKTMAEAEKNKKEGAAFLDENKKKPGVITTPSGLQYKIIKPGTGKFPHDSDVVTVNYIGRLINGKVFDSSFERKQPATFQLNLVLKGWVEGLQKIKEGGKIELFIPSDLGYDDRPAGDLIKPGSTLIFEVELIKVGPPAKKK